MTVFLVGAGPGDPGLLTVRGAEVLARAEVVVYDRLSIESLLRLAPTGAERVSVGKSPGSHTLPQPEINELLVERGRSGATVVRLKGGDPFVFARGGEEAAALAEAGVAFEIVPGVTSATAGPAYAGVPLTLRHSSTSFTVLTGHEDPATADEIDWEAVARLGGTIVILMGVARLRSIVEHLRAGGLSDDTPAMAVRWATRPNQQTVRATLATIADHDLAAPSVIVIGQVAGMDLNWFESRPLFGRRIVVTRAPHQAPQLCAALLACGAEPIEVPVIEIAEPADEGVALAGAMARCRDGEYDWVVLTSPNGADRFCSELRDGRDLAGTKLAAIGPGTAEELIRHKLVADLVARRHVAEGLIEDFPSPAGKGRVLLARAAVARDVLPDALAAMGWDTDVVEAYRTVPIELGAEERALLCDADAVTFTSSSTVTSLMDSLGSLPRGADGRSPAVATIGPITSRAALDRGLVVDAEADPHTIEGLVAALCRLCGDDPAHS